ncbi:phage portal protein [Listeria monocytogenes]|uniref:phage portal protein n=1 Tax=Listeria monocytogenes TaxID=1639 RepID=UPI000873503B|nr:phage portal protein [Listeria monocytogenes]EAC7998122.1 phage portal protein [Listeria monocytogenes]EAC8350567.1 phage portal protein [Listeria monocytogenes]EAD9140318.1 phage portal protein [Listeria monocytogenes]EIL9239385.1 phage portal protein [Listeria monocytogenes]EJC6459508.1 phage portal protein [Listeria monocytogenes]
MGLREQFSNYVFKRSQNTGLYDDIIDGFVRYNSFYSNKEDILKSSDVYELMQDISNQVSLAEVVVEENGEEVHNHPVLNIINHPNDYLTGFEFKKLLINEYLLNGEVFPVLIDNQLHLLNNVQVELNDKLIPVYKSCGTQIYNWMIRHVKYVGLSHLKGVGIKELARDTLDGVLSAEKSLTNKYQKGGLMAFLLRLDGHINPTNGAQKKIIKAIRSQLEGIDNPNQVKIIPLGRGYNIETLDSPVDDEKTLKYLSVYKKDLGKFLGINVETYQNLMKTDIEKAMMNMHNKAVRPILRNLEDHLSLLFFGKNSNKRIKFKINILDFVTYSTKTNIGYNLVRTLIATPDDAREMLGFKKLNTEESSKLYISKDLIAGGNLGNATDDRLKGGEDGNENGTSNV